MNLGLGKNDLSDIRAGMWVGLESLERFSLGSNKLTEIRKDMWWKGMKHLKYLWLNKNNITRIEDGAFQKLKRLEELSLYWNRLTSLRPEMFQGLSRLRTLSLFQNRISAIESGTFASLRKISSIRLDYNRLTTLTDLFQGGYPAQEVDINLAGNTIPCDSSLCWVRKPEYQLRVKVWLYFCPHETQTYCHSRPYDWEKIQCLSNCQGHVVQNEDDADENNGDDDVILDTQTGTEILVLPGDDTDKEAHDDEEDSNNIDNDEDDDVSIQQNETNVTELIPNESSFTETMIRGENETLIAIQATYDNGIINQMWRIVKALLNAVENFWLRITGAQ